MSNTLTFTRHVRVNGALADADSAPLLTDSAATFGVKRIDTGAVVVAAETVAGGISHDGTGLYSYPLANPIAGVTYQAAFKFVVNGQTVYSTPTLYYGGPSVHYGSQPGMVALLGPANEQTYANINSDDQPATIAAMEEAALTEGDAKVNAYLLGQGVTSLPVASSDAWYGLLTAAANRYSAMALSRMRGLPTDARGKPVDPYTVYGDEAAAYLSQFAANRLYGATNAGAPPTPDAGVARGSVGAFGVGVFCG